MRRSLKVSRAPVIAGSPGPEHCCFLVAGSSLFITGYWKGLSTPFLKPKITFLTRQKCRHGVKSRKIKESYSIWCLKPSEVQKNPFGMTFVYIIYLFKRKQPTRGGNSGGSVKHTTLGMLLLLLRGVSWPVLTLLRVMWKALAYRRKQKQVVRKTAWGSAENMSSTIAFCSRKYSLENFSSDKNGIS